MKYLVLLVSIQVARRLHCVVHLIHMWADDCFRLFQYGALCDMIAPIVCAARRADSKVTIVRQAPLEDLQNQNQIDVPEIRVVSSTPRIH